MSASGEQPLVEYWNVAELVTIKDRCEPGAEGSRMAWTWTMSVADALWLANEIILTVVEGGADERDDTA